MSVALLNNRYELQSKTGIGGMAYVYKAQDTLLNRTVAVKTLKDEFAQDKEFIKRFKDEALAVAKLSHENIVNVYDVGYDNNLNYIVMEYIEGTTLSNYLETAAPLDSKEVVDIGLQIFAALEHAHVNGIIHRDIKPQNILISKNGKIKVTDFGIAKAINAQTLTTDNKAFGSVHYISPEQAKGLFLDSRTDIYSTGIVMYEMVTGKVPYDADTPIAIVMKHLQDKIVEPIELRSDIDPELNRIILKATKKNPADRYESAQEVMVDLMNMGNYNNGKNGVTLDFLNGEVGSYTGMTMDIPKTDEDDLYLTDDEGIMQGKTTDVQEVIRNSGRIPKNEYYDLEYNVPLVYARGRKKKEKKYVFTTLIAILCVLAISTVFVVYAIDELAKVVVPEPKEYEVLNYVTYDYETIKEKLEKDFDIKVLIKEVPSDETPAGIIMDQDVEQGRIFKEGVVNTITFTVSSGKNVVEVPFCIGMDYRIAQNELIAAGLVPEIVEQFDQDSQPGTVLATVPAAESQIKYGETVRLIVSKGSQYAKVAVPDLIGKTKEEARAELAKFNLKMNIMSEEQIEGKKITVTYQYPDANVQAYEQSVVDVRLAYDPENIAYEDIEVTFRFNPAPEDLVDLEFPLTLRFKIDFSDKSGSTQTTHIIRDIGDFPYEKEIRLPAKGETRISVFIGSVLYKEPYVLKYFEYYSDND